MQADIQEEIKMSKIISAMVCVFIPMIVSTILQQVFHFSDYLMIAIYFIMFAILFFFVKKKGWLRRSHVTY